MHLKGTQGEAVVTLGRENFHFMADAVETDPITGSIEPGRTNNSDRCPSVTDNYSTLSDEELARMTKGLKSAFRVLFSC